MDHNSNIALLVSYCQFVPCQHVFIVRNFGSNICYFALAHVEPHLQQWHLFTYPWQIPLEFLILSQMPKGWSVSISSTFRDIFIKSLRFLRGAFTLLWTNSTYILLNCPFLLAINLFTIIVKHAIPNKSITKHHKPFLEELPKSSRTISLLQMEHQSFVFWDITLQHSPRNHCWV